MRLGYPALGEPQTAPAAPPHGKGGGRAGVSAGEPCGYVAAPQDRCPSGGSKGDADEEAYWRRMYAELVPLSLDGVLGHHRLVEPLLDIAAEAVRGQVGEV